MPPPPDESDLSILPDTNQYMLSPSESVCKAYPDFDSNRSSVVSLDECTCCNSIENDANAKLNNILIRDGKKKSSLYVRAESRTCDSHVHVTASR